MLGQPPYLAGREMCHPHPCQKVTHQQLIIFWVTLVFPSKMGGAPAKRAVPPKGDSAGRSACPDPHPPQGHLPAPLSLQYLESVHHLMTPERFRQTEALAREFQKKMAPRLQKYLILKSWWATNYVSPSLPSLPCEEVLSHPAPPAPFLAWCPLSRHSLVPSPDPADLSAAPKPKRHMTWEGLPLQKGPEVSTGLAGSSQTVVGGGVGSGHPGTGLSLCCTTGTAHPSLSKGSFFPLRP